MNDPKPTFDTRKTHQWWTYTEDLEVKRVTGYSCAPGAPDSWWCPEVGYTLQEKHHLFDSEGEALDAGIKQLEESIKDETAALQAFKARRKYLP